MWPGWDPGTEKEQVKNNGIWKFMDFSYLSHNNTGPILKSKPLMYNVNNG